MKFRPCIDIHSGQVKQIVGSTLTESAEDKPVENFSTSKGAAEFASLYRDSLLTGGHVIMLDNRGGEDNATEQAALAALKAYPGGLQIGGGVTAATANKYLKAGASHVIVTSYIFKDGAVQFDLLEQLANQISKNRLVLDLSCRRRTADGPYYVVTNKWTKFTDFALTPANLQRLSAFCAEFLVHAVDVEGKQAGIEEDLVSLFAHHSPIPCTYAGGVSGLEDLAKCRDVGLGRVDVTVGSALDIFGGPLPYTDVVTFCAQDGAP